MLSDDQIKDVTNKIKELADVRTQSMDDVDTVLRVCMSSCLLTMHDVPLTFAQTTEESLREISNFDKEPSSTSFSLLITPSRTQKDRSRRRPSRMVPPTERPPLSNPSSSAKKGKTDFYLFAWEDVSFVLPSFSLILNSVLVLDGLFITSLVSIRCCVRIPSLLEMLSWYATRRRTDSRRLQNRYTTRRDDGRSTTPLAPILVALILPSRSET